MKIKIPSLIIVAILWWVRRRQTKETGTRRN